MNEIVNELVLDALEAFNSHNIDKFMEFYAEDAKHFQPTQSLPIKNRDSIREDFIKTTFIPFPDVQFEVTNIFSQGEWTCIEGMFKGTHKAPLGEGDEMIPATYKYVEVPICFVVKIENEKMVEVHEYNDQLGFLKQLGVM